ncbi:MAG: hypothetical protein WDA07_11755 [Leucobacter sp.]
MPSESFLRLPQYIQDIVTSGLEEEIKAAFEKIERERTSQTMEEEQIRFYEGDIVRASALRASLTGEEASL